MRVQEAVKERILELCREKGMSVNKLAEKSGVSASTLKWTVKPYARVQNTGVVTVKRLCQGLNIDFKTFWDSPFFNDLDFEISPSDND